MSRMVLHSVSCCRDGEYFLEHVGLSLEFHEQSNSGEEWLSVTTASLSFKYDGKSAGVGGMRWILLSRERKQR